MKCTIRVWGAAAVVAMASQVKVHADFVPIDFSEHHNKRIQNRDALFPEGMVILGDVPFNIPIGGDNEWGSGDGIGGGGGNNGIWIIDIDVGVFGVMTVHTLINTDWGTTQSGRMVLEFFGSDGAYFQRDLIGNDDTRDWSQRGFTNNINGITTINVVTIPNGTNGTEDRMDKQAIALPSDFFDETLTSIRVTDDRTTFVHSGLLSGLTVETGLVMATLDIKPGSCPNSFNRNSNGVLPVALVGSDTFDVKDVDLASILLVRKDGLGGSVAPHEGPPGPHSTFGDTATPFEGDPQCDCHELEGDGIQDLNMKFKTQLVVDELDMAADPNGALVSLTLIGTLLDGTPFEADDCVRLVPPGTPPGAVAVGSNVSGVFIDVTPLDSTLDGGGFANFERTYPLTTVVTLTAPETHPGWVFVGWLYNPGPHQGGGGLYLDRTFEIIINDKEFWLKAIYLPATGDTLQGAMTP